MPTALIEVRRDYSDSEATAIMEAVHAALVSAFQIPVEDRHVRLITHRAERFLVSPKQATPDRYTLVTIDCFAGRSVDAKRALYRHIVDRLEPLGIPRTDITITLREAALENWGIAGGQAANDIDLGFDVTV